VIMTMDTLPKPVTASTALLRVILLIQRWGLLIVALVAIMVGATPARATTPARSAPAVSTSDPRSGALMSVAINKSQTLRVEQAIGKAAIGNEMIADVVPISASSVYILGKALGSTNLSLYDRKGGLIAVVDIAVTPDAQGLKAKLAELLPTEAVGVSVSNDTVVLDGKISSPAAAQRIAAIAETYSPKKVLNLMSIGTAQQILLEVRFAEMSRTTVKSLGINNINFSGGAVSGIVNSGGLQATAPTPGSYVTQLTFPNLQVQFEALEREGLVRTLAQPNLIALSGENASFLAGGEFPVPVGVALNGQVAIEFKPFGVSLSFTPTLLEDGLINLVVQPEVSQLDNAAGINLNGLVIPGLRVRRSKTTLELRDGQAFAMAGLIRSDFADNVGAVPLLGRLPIIGALFRSTNFNRTESELVIIVTPRLVRPVAPGSLVAPTDRILEPSDYDLFLNGNAEKRVPAKAVLPQAANRPGGVEGDFGHIVR